MAARSAFLLNAGFRFQLDTAAPPACKDPNGTFPIDINGQQCAGLSQTNANSLEDCIGQCCAESSSQCSVYQWCGANGSCTPKSSCWIGSTAGGCTANGQGWESRARTPSPPPPPSNKCTDPRCLPGTDDSGWEGVTLPHDFVVTFNFSQSADMGHGYLPYGAGWYRRHIAIPAAFASGTTMYIDVDGAQSTSTVWLNGFLLGTHSSGYTGARYFVNASTVLFGADNLLAVFVDATTPDGWW